MRPLIVADWPLIETAPRDGTKILAYGYVNDRHVFGMAYYVWGLPNIDDGWMTSSFYLNETFIPTHWWNGPMEPIVDYSNE